MAIALLFGLGALQCKVGEFSHAGPGLFPLLVSCLVFLIGVVTVVRSYFVPPVPISYNVKNIVFILTALGGFAFLSEHVNMIVGILFLVFCSAFAGSGYSVARNLKIAVALIIIAFMFRNLLGLNLPLY